MSLATFRSEAKKAAQTYAAQYGLTPAELEYALVANADLEGGLGEEAGVGDGGASVSRYQFNTAGGHGSTLLNQGYTRDQIASDEFAVNHWAPILAQSIANAKKSGLSGNQAIVQGIFAAERPAQMYPQSRINAAFDNAAKLTGSSGGTSMTSPASATNDRQAFANWARDEFGLVPPDPKDYPPVYVKDDKGNDTKTVASSTAQQLQEAQAAYFKSLGSLAPIWNATKSPTAKGELSPDQKAQQDIKNKMDALDLQVKAGTLDAQKAATELTAYINEQKNALDLGTQQQKAHEQLDLYGPGGDFSYNDMGGAFADYAGRNGIDANSSALRFTTPQPFDPAAAYKTNAATMGITGGPPQNQNTMLDLIQKAMAGNGGATGSIGGAASGGLGDVGAAVSAAGDAMQPQYIIPGATVGAGAAPSGLSPDAITPYVPPWAGRTLQKPPQLVGGL